MITGIQSARSAAVRGWTRVLNDTNKEVIAIRREAEPWLSADRREKGWLPRAITDFEWQMLAQSAVGRLKQVIKVPVATPGWIWMDARLQPLLSPPALHPSVTLPCVPLWSRYPFFLPFRRVSSPRIPVPRMSSVPPLLILLPLGSSKPPRVSPATIISTYSRHQGAPWMLL